jgi:hypothetical protein
MSASGLTQQAMGYEEHVHAETRHANSLLTLENKRLHRQLEIQRQITQEWERRFDLLLKLIPAIKHEPEAWAYIPPQSSWWRRLFSGRTDRPFCP